MAVKNERAEAIKNIVTIPKYFEEIIHPRMQDYYSTYGIDFDSKPYACCPLHSEVTPSFRFFDETKSFYCYGCNQGGDIIALHRKFMEAIGEEIPSFADSLAFLEGYFIHGRIDLEVVTTEDKVDDKISSVAEVLRLSNYVEKVEQLLYVETEIDKNTKMELYGLIDDLIRLVTCNIVNATDALNNVKETVKNKIHNKGAK